MVEITTKKKRGRKPKNFNMVTIKTEIEAISEEEIISEDEKIIFHLPITMNEINSYDNADNTDMGIFIKSEKDAIQKTIEEDSESIETIKSSSNSNKLNNTVNKIITHYLNFNKNTKCWWCKNQFNSPAVQLPENYYNNTFYCTGHFCSFNCMKTYNLELNDTLSWKRESLINLLYYQTYSEYKNIIPAPHWITLEEYGGTLSINKFRENSFVNIEIAPKPESLELIHKKLSCKKKFIYK